jgi:sarcosine oxidase
MGAMTLWRLACAGIKAIGFEQYTIGHDRSAAGGESRMFRTAYREGTQYVPLLERARDLWCELEVETGRSLLSMTGGLMIGDAGSNEIRNVLASAERFAVPHEVLDATAMVDRYPQHRPLLRGEVAVLDRKAGVIRPEFSVLAAVRRAQHLGATVHDQTRVTAVKADADGVTVHTDGRDYRVGQAVVAAGRGPRGSPPDPVVSSHRAGCC